MQGGAEASWTGTLVAKGRATRGWDSRDIEDEARAVVAGRLTLPAHDLLALIHAVNPTGRELAPRDAARRYALKSSLQSVLVRRFREDLVVHPDPAQPGTAILHHRYLGADACHAIVANLDEDVRSWVQRELDLGEDVRSEAPRPAGRSARNRAAGTPSVPEADPVALLRSGREALAEYDFDAARERFVEALRGSGGGPEAAVALLSLLVEHLAAYEDALEVRGRLSEEALARSEVRVLVALAAAHTGESALASRTVKGLSGPAAAEVQTVLASAACRSGDLEAAERHVAAAREADATHPQLAALRTELARLVERRMRPREDALRELLDSEGLEAAEPVARALLVDWPGCELARRIVREADQKRRTTEAGRLLGRAEELLAAGELVRARSLAEQARGLGAGAWELLGRLAEAERSSRAEREREAVAEVERLLDGADRAAGLVAYLGLRPELRAHVRTGRDTSEIAALETLEASPGKLEASQAVPAVLALGEATRALHAGDAEGALGLLRSHENVLDGLPSFRKLRESARAALESQRVEAARAKLEAARAAVDARRLDEAARILASVDGRGLPPTLQDEVTVVRARVDRDLDVARRAARVEALAASDPLEARRQALRLARLTDGEEQGRWTDRAAALQEAVQTAFRVQVLGVEIDARTALADAAADLDSRSATIDPDAAEVVLASAHGCWVFLRAIDIATQTARRLGMLRTPEPLGDVIRVDLRGQRLWLVGSEGGVLELDPSWQVLGWRSLRALFPTERGLAEAYLAPGERYLWVLVESTESVPLRVIDLERWRVHKELSDAFEVELLGSGAAARVACLDVFDRLSALYLPSGTPAGRLRLPEGAQLKALSDDPLGNGLLLLGFRLGPRSHEQLAVGATSGGGPLELVRYLPATGALAADCLDIKGETGPSEDLAAHLRSCRVSQMAFVGFDGEPGCSEVVAVDVRGAFEERYRFRIRHADALVGGGDGQRLMLVAARGSGITLVELGHEDPKPPEPLVLDRRLPGLEAPFFCEPRAEEIDRLELFRLPASQQRLLVQRYVAEHADDAVAILALAREVAMLRGFEEDLSRLLEQARAPELRIDALSALHLASIWVRQGRWAEVKAVLENANPSQLARTAACHFHHLLGLALFHLGDLDGARAVWTDGLAYVDADQEGFGCRLDTYLALVAPRAAPVEPAAESSPRLLDLLLDAFHAADAAFARGDAERVQTLLFRMPLLGAHDELQVLGRLAEAELRLPAPSDNLGRYRKAYALARFVGAWEQGAPRVDNLAIPALAWSRERLEEVSMRSRAWLETTISATD